MHTRTQLRRSANPSSVKSKHIHKYTQPQIVKVTPLIKIPQEEVPIYHESSQEKSYESYELKKECEQAVMATLKIESPEEQSSSEWMGQNVSEDHVPTKRVHIRYSQERNPIIHASHFKRVQHIDFEIFCTCLSRIKIYGAMLMDQCGRLLWCDKIAHELLEGSLNNFQRVCITDLLLNSQLPAFLQQLNSIQTFNERTILQWIIYSKNSKRRYKDVLLSMRPSNADIFYRFLKALTVRVRPISIDLPAYRDVNGFCNQKLFEKDQYNNCFLVELRHTKSTPDLNGLDLHNDPIIKKYLKKMRQDQFFSKRQKNTKMLDEQEESNEQMEEKLQTNDRVQESFRGIKGKKQTQGAGAVFMDEQKIDKQHQKQRKQLS